MDRLTASCPTCGAPGYADESGPCQSLSQEAVRDEVLEEAARVVWVDGEKPSETWTDAQTGKPAFDPIQVSRMQLAAAIRALKREPNAASFDMLAELKSRLAEPAPAAPDVASMVKRLRDYRCADPWAGALMSEAATLLANLGQRTNQLERVLELYCPNHPLLSASDLDINPPLPGASDD